jgi:hypothetical protein
MKKLTINFVREQFEKEGYVLLSNVYVNARELLKYICPKGDYGTITWDCWQRGHRCKRCSIIKNSNKSRYTTKFVQEQFKKEGYVLLTEKYINSTQKLDYTCINGHTYSISWNSWQQGHRCPECNRLKMLGKNNHKWKSELTEEDRIKDRSYPEYKEWRTAVYKRDNYTCQCCGKRCVELNAHHIESYNNNLGLRTILDNGACLCKKCHKNFHHQYGRGNNTKEQFIEFKSNYKNPKVKKRPSPTKVW